MTTAEAARLLLGWDELLLLTHVRPDGDTVGSAAALCQALRDRGKTAYLLPNPELTATYAPYAAPYAAPEGFVPRHVVSVDIAALSLLPENARPYQDRIDLAIDHHPSQEFFARETCLEAESAACGEIVYNIVTLMTPLTPEIALPLYVAVSTDTGCFVYSNTTARTHRIAAALMDCGIDVAPVNKALFRTKSRTRLAMEAWMAEWAEYYDHDPPGGRHADPSVPVLGLQGHGGGCGGAVQSGCPGGGHRLRRDPAGAEGRPGENFPANRPRVNATEVCALLGGGGHAAAAGATLHGTLGEVKQAVLQAIDMVAGED